MIKKYFFASFLIITFILSILAFYFFIENFINPQFNDQGRFFDSSTGIVYSDNSFSWGIISLVCILPTILTIFIRIFKRR